MTSTPARKSGPVWSRPEPERRAPLDRARIVAAATGLADAEGLDAVSIRRVAAVLGARPMSLYNYIGSKEDLLDLMFDELAGEVLKGGPLPPGWREAMTVVAGRKRQLCLAHPWAIRLYGRRPRVGPHVLMQLERSVVALRPLTTDLADAVQIVNAVDDYTMGHVTRELTFGGSVAGEWEETMRPYLRGLVESGRYPVLAPLLVAPVSDDGDATFAAGLAWFLDGIGARFGDAG
jgi:AcrR family transcriptional regulator